MNQSKKFLKQQKKIKNVKDVQPDFSEIPAETICQSIQLLINELKRRGCLIYDFDHKNKIVHGLKIVHGKIFFIAAEERHESK